MFQKYYYVLAVYEEGSFTKAAKRLIISQPSLSVAVKNIEKSLGAPLFERKGFEITTTEVGELYIAAAKKMELAKNEFNIQLADRNGLKTGSLVVAGSNYLSSDLLPIIISSFRAKHPGVDITLSEANSTHLREMLAAEDIDIAIDNFEGDKDVCTAFPIMEEQIMLCISADKPINDRLTDFQITPDRIYDRDPEIENIPPLDISVFEKEDFILLKEGNDMYKRATEMFADRNIDPKVVFYVDQLNISCALAASGSGVCLIADTFFKYRKHSENVVLYKIDHRSAHRTLHICHKKGKYRTKAMTEFIRIAEETTGERGK